MAGIIRRPAAAFRCVCRVLLCGYHPLIFGRDVVDGSIIGPPIRHLDLRDCGQLQPIQLGVTVIIIVGLARDGGVLGVAGSVVARQSNC